MANFLLFCFLMFFLKIPCKLYNRLIDMHTNLILQEYHLWYQNREAFYRKKLWLPILSKNLSKHFDIEINIVLFLSTFHLLSERLNCHNIFTHRTSLFNLLLQKYFQIFMLYQDLRKNDENNLIYLKMQLKVKLYWNFFTTTYGVVNVIPFLTYHILMYDDDLCIPIFLQRHRIIHFCTFKFLLYWLC